ncbi:MAG: hypothetical protein V4620_02395 [Bacteroidota bacterium]
MKQIIQNQTIGFDTHQAGDGQVIKVDELHMHKRMNEGKYRGVDIRIPLDPNKEIIYTGNNSRDAERIISEIKRVFKKDSSKVTEMAKYVANTISRYATDMLAEESKAFLDNSASSIAKHFDLEGKIANRMTREINKHISFYITSHRDETGKLFYIKQDIDRKRIKLGDDLEKLLYGNGKYK